VDTSKPANEQDQDKVFILCQSRFCKTFLRERVDPGLYWRSLGGRQGSPGMEPERRLRCGHWRAAGWPPFRIHACQKAI